MTYFADLTPYKYNQSQPDPNTLNIGWLEGDQPFPIGDTPREFHERLWLFLTGVVWLTRGFHYCTICQDHKLAVAQLKQSKLGSAEIRVFYNGKTYAAPNLIYHYVVDHHYQPPAEFIEAVLNGDLPGSRSYLKHIRNLGADFVLSKHKSEQTHSLLRIFGDWLRQKFSTQR